jgi:hypothetical protein
MVKHIVLWKLDAGYSAEDKKTICNDFHKKLYNLKNEITVLAHIEVFMNNEKTSVTNYDIMLDTAFNSLDDLNTYLSHPAHLKVVEYVKTLKLQRAAIDFMI